MSKVILFWKANIIPGIEDAAYVVRHDEKLPNSGRPKNPHSLSSWLDAGWEIESGAGSVNTGPVIVLKYAR